MSDLFNSNSWEDSKEEKEILGKDEFKVLAEGDNQVRLIGKYVFRNVHYNPEWKMNYITCSGDGCPICASGETPKLNYYINILDRKDNKIKLMKFGVTLKRKFQNLNAKYGDLTNFDLIITRTGTKLDTRYEVLPTMNNKPLTDEEKKYIADNYIDLDAKFIIPTAQQVRSMMTGDDSTEYNTKVTNKPDVETTPLNNVVKSSPISSSVKECFGIGFNPMKPNCKSCELLSNCKKLTIENLSK